MIRDLMRAITRTSDEYPEFYKGSKDSSISSITSSSNYMNLDEPTDIIKRQKRKYYHSW